MTPLEAAREASYACDALTLGKFALLEDTPGDVRSYCIEHYCSLGGCNRSLPLVLCQRWAQDAYRSGRGSLSAAWWRNNPWSAKQSERWGPRIYFREAGQPGHFFFQPGLALAEFQLGLPDPVALNGLDRIQQALGILAHTAPTPFWKAQVYEALAHFLSTARQRHVSAFDKMEAMPKRPGQDTEDLRRRLQKRREQVEKLQVMPQPDTWSRSRPGQRDTLSDEERRGFYMP